MKKSRKSQKSLKIAIFASSEMFEKLGNYRNISEIRKTAISETRENENFGKKCLTQGLTRHSNFLLILKQISLATGPPEL